MYLNEIEGCSKEEMTILYFKYVSILLKYKYYSNVRALMNNNYISLYWICKKINPSPTQLREDVEMAFVKAQNMIEQIPTRQDEKKKIICERLDNVIVALEPIDEDEDYDSTDHAD